MGMLVIMAVVGGTDFLDFHQYRIDPGNLAVIGVPLPLMSAGWRH